MLNGMENSGNKNLYFTLFNIGETPKVITLRIEPMKLGIVGEGVSIRDIVTGQSFNAGYDEKRKYLNIAVPIDRGDVRVLKVGDLTE